MAAVLRRSSSCPLIPLVFRSSPLIPGYFSSVLHPRNRLFSADTHSFDEKIENEMATYSHGLPLPSGFPFRLNIRGLHAATLTKKDRKEFIRIVINPFNRNIHASIKTTSVEISTVMIANLDEDQVDIHEVTAWDPNGVMGDYIDYIQTKGITPKTISWVYNLLGYQDLI